MDSQVVFNLYSFSENIFLPNAYLVEVDRNGLLTHAVQKIKPDNLAVLGQSVSEVEKRAFEQIAILQPLVIAQKFQPPKSKKTPTLEQLLSDLNTKSVVEGHVFRNLDSFFNIIYQNRLPLTFDLEKKSLVKDHLVAFAREELVPYLHFKKTPLGVEYQLKIGTETEQWRIAHQNIFPLTNTVPAWVFANYTIFRVPGINGFMLKPFLKKDTVFIPQKNVKEYFQKIIVKNANRTQIVTEGFEVEIQEKLLSAELQISQDVLQQRCRFDVQFGYAGARFDAFEKRRQITWVEFPDTEHVHVKQVHRSATAERVCLDFLEKMGLVASHQSYYLPDNVTFSDGIAWLSAQRNALQSAGFTLLLPEVEGRKLNLLQGNITVQTIRHADWFDVEGVVQVGEEHQFPFRCLVPFLKNGDPFFPLPDGTFFLIPEAWFTQYSDLARSLKSSENAALRLPKTLYTVLSDAGLLEEDSGSEIVPQSIDFQLPNKLQATLRPYQLEGVKWLIAHHQQGFGACLADDMGLGKTLQTIAVLLWAKEILERENLAIASPKELPIATPAAPKKKQIKAQKTAGVQLDLFAAPQDFPTENYHSDVTPIPSSKHRKFCALIILPASLVFNWRAEFEKFTEGLFIYVHTGAKRLNDPNLLSAHDVVLTTYHTARNDLDLLQKVRWSYLVLDESQQIKNRSSEISKVVRHLEADHKISLSGTPIENSLADLWTQMEFINPDTLGSFEHFKKHFILPIEKNDDEAVKSALFRRVQPYFLRRTKDLVAPDLPPLSDQIFYSEMTAGQRALYEKVKSAMRNQILELFETPNGKLEVLQALTRLRQIANHPALLPAGFEDMEGLENLDSGKFEDVLLQWETIRRSGHKVLVFSNFEKYLELFRQHFEAKETPYAWLSGATSAADRPREVAKFQSDPKVQVFLMTTKSGGVGLNLTAADYVFILDPWWNPAVELQAIARAHRLGLEHPVTAVRFITVDSVEEKIRILQARKAQLGAGLFADSGGLPEGFTREDLEVLLM